MLWAEARPLLAKIALSRIIGERLRHPLERSGLITRLRSCEAGWSPGWEMSKNKPKGRTNSRLAGELKRTHHTSNSRNIKIPKCQNDIKMIKPQNVKIPKWQNDKIQTCQNQKHVKMSKWQNPCLICSFSIFVHYWTNSSHLRMLYVILYDTHVDDQALEIMLRSMGPGRLTEWRSLQLHEPYY